MDRLCEGSQRERVSTAMVLTQKSLSGCFSLEMISTQTSIADKKFFVPCFEAQTLNISFCIFEHLVALAFALLIWNPQFWILPANHFAGARFELIWEETNL